mmetsp:Transcript_9241/g.26007  ORF Transcript_9241/g.26007 Transcript_9241/m.26007 type:complete len:665 (-) Transcript_9241:104-2098(-)
MTWEYHCMITDNSTPPHSATSRPRPTVLGAIDQRPTPQDDPPAVLDPSSSLPAAGGGGGGGGMSDDDDDEFDALPQEPDSEDEGDDNGAGGDVGTKEAGAAVGTSSGDDPTVPKHLLPVAGTSIIRRLLGSVASAGFSRCVVAVAASDNGLTVKSILSEEAAAAAAATSSGGGGSSISRVSDRVLRLVIGGSSSGAGGGGKKGKASAAGAGKTMEISIVTLGANSGGSADAIRHLSGAGAVPASSHLVVLPGDLVLAASLGDGSSLRVLADAHRRGQQAPMRMMEQSGGKRSERAGDASSFAPPACTLLLSDVGDEDENGIPLKESAKAKKGGLARDEEDIEYIGLSSSATAPSPHQPSSPRRLIMKQSKVVVEEDEGTGSTPKLVLPKGRFRHPAGPTTTTIRTDLNDLHVYALSPWVVKLLSVRPGLSSLQKEVLPLLVLRQFRGVAAAFGSAALDGSSEAREALDDVLASGPFAYGGTQERGRESIAAAADDGDQQDGAGDGQRRSPPASPPFAVSAQVLNRSTSRLSLRCATIPAYLYGCREVVAEAAKAGADVHKAVFPDGTQVNSKFQSIVLPESSVGEKVTLKSSTVGKGAKLGGRCRLNNVVILDGASVGDNCILQNSVLGAGCIIGENCNLNDCQVAPGAEVPSLTKEKGESFLR